MWDLHDRMEDSLNRFKCRDITNSFSQQGQMIPALGRRVSDCPGIDVELIYGARRLFAARRLRVPINVQITDVDDTAAILMMFAENAVRKDLSPYERGIAFKCWLRRGYFSTQNELAEAIGLSVSTVSRLLSFASIPAVILGAFPDPTLVKEQWAVEIARLCDDPGRRKRAINTARKLKLSKSSASSRAIYKRLVGTGRARPAEKNRSRIIRDPETGESLFRIREQNLSLSIRIPSAHVVDDTEFLVRTLTIAIRKIKRAGNHGVAVDPERKTI